MPDYVAVTCQTCGLRFDIPEGSTASEEGAGHLKVCLGADVYRFVPAWSVGFPYYHSEVKDFTLDVGWKHHDSLVAVPSGIQTGSMAKLWHSFSPVVQSKIILAAS